MKWSCLGIFLVMLEFVALENFAPDDFKDIL